MGFSDTELTVTAKQVAHIGSLHDNGSGSMVSLPHGTQLFTSGKAVQLVFACDGGQPLEVDVTAGDRLISKPAACDGGAISIEVPAGQRDQVSFATKGTTPQGRYAYLWYES